jgi:hypothetical protein
MSSVIRFRVTSCRTYERSTPQQVPGRYSCAQKSLWREGGYTQAEFKLILSRKMLNPLYFFLNLSLVIASFVQLSLMWAVLESIKNLLIWKHWFKVQRCLTRERRSGVSHIFTHFYNLSVCRSQRRDNLQGLVSFFFQRRLRLPAAQHKDLNFKTSRSPLKTICSARPIL